MFPDPCGEAFEKAVAAGAEPALVVPDEYVVVRGGTSPMPPIGQQFSGATGPSVSAAAAAVPFGRIRIATVGAIRALGGSVVWQPELSKGKTWNRQHVNIVEGGDGSFGELLLSPVPRRLRIDGNIP
jgi:hypothetical protein